MAIDKAIDSAALDAGLLSVANAIRTKGGTSASLAFPAGFVSAVEAITAGGGEAITRKGVNFYDYDGTLLHSYTVAEAQELAELPALPAHDGLVCQGWNYDLNTIKSHNREMCIGANYTTDDGKTRIYITLEEGRTTPMLCACPNGTVTVDWGDGTAPDTLTGTSVTVARSTPNHSYAAVGDYVITLTVNGTVGFGGFSFTSTRIIGYATSNDARNSPYSATVRKVELGDGVKTIGARAFGDCYNLESISVPNTIESLGSQAFGTCYSLKAFIVPDGVTLIPSNCFVNNTTHKITSIPNSVTTFQGFTFDYNRSREDVVLPDSLTRLGDHEFRYAANMKYLEIPNGVTSIGTRFCYDCSALERVGLPDGLTRIGDYAFYGCSVLSSLEIPDDVTSIGNYAFYGCTTLTNMKIPSGVTTIPANTFTNCTCMKYYDFTDHTAVPTLSGTAAFNNIPPDCEIRVPASLYSEWAAATNWATYASNIVGV